jgi:Tol biopolymer transport system component
MRSALITVSVLVCVFAGALLHLQATAGAASATAAVKAEVSPIYLMGAAHIPGFNDTQWRTSLEVCNFGGVSRSIELGFLQRDQGNPVPDAVELTLASGQCVNYPDAVVSIFGYDEAVGTIRLVADGDGVVAVARTYNDTPDGTYGTALGSNPVEEAAADGASTVLVHLAQSASDSDGFRTNLDLLNVTDLEIAVEIALYTSTGSHYGTLSTALEPFEYSQETRVFRQVSGDEVTDGYAVVRTATPGGAVMAAASLVDNRTGDTTTISGSAVPTTERWLDAVNMGTVINTSQSEWYPVLARDGSFMIFVSDRFGGYGSGDLYISRFVNGEWQAPQNLGPDVNSSGFDSAPYLSADGSTLYFTSDGIGGGGNFDIWYCSLTNGIPGPRTRMPSPISTVAIDCCPVLSADGDTLYICSNRSGGFGSLDVWASRRAGGHWQPPVNLGETVNTIAIDSPRWISDDGNTLIIDSNRPGRIGGVDLWSVARIGVDWLAPVNLGAPVNSRWDEQGPGFFGNDGAIGGMIYFGSSRPGGYGGQDIWCSDFSTPMVSGAAIATGAGPFRIPPVSTVARETDHPAADPAPVGSGCCSSDAT